MFLKSHTYMINLDNVDYFKGKIHQPTGKHGTVFTMNNGNYLQITCPVEVVLKTIKNVSTVNGIKPNVIKLEYGDNVKYECEEKG